MKEREELTDDEKHILTVSILIECAKGDNDFSDDEISKNKKCNQT